MVYNLLVHRQAFHYRNTPILERLQEELIKPSSLRLPYSWFEGAAIGFLLDRPDGAVAGCVLGSVVHHLGNDIAQRLLSRREEIRLGCSY